MDMKKYKKIIDKIRELGFENFHQAGSPNKFHELNIVIEDEINDIQYWITKSFGEYSVIYRNSIHDIKQKQHKYKCDKTQKSVCETFEKVVNRDFSKLTEVY